MEVTVQPNLLFHGVDFVNLKLVTEQRYDSRASINLNIEPKVFYPDDEPNVFKIFMEVTVNCENYFSLNLVGIGAFEFDKEFEDSDLKKAFINTNAPAIMFPYIRSFISTLTSSLGNVTGPLIIPTQFFQGDLTELIIDEEQ